MIALEVLQMKNVQMKITNGFVQNVSNIKELLKK